ncbi:DUF1697 domain-containing protein [Paenibacillus marinisediminis]
MTTYIALLRGINVGGKNMIKMSELKQMCEAIGLSQIRTYIQSGNVLFKSDQDEESIRKLMEHEIERVFGFSISVVIRTAEEIKRVADSCPFSEKEIEESAASCDGESLYAAFLLDKPSPESMDRLKNSNNENDEYRIVGRDVYLLFRSSIRNSKLANNLNKLDVPATTRNFKTINKLIALANDME